MSCTAESLFNSASCLSCLSEKQLMAINVFLLCQILNGGGGVANPPVVYIADPNTEGLTPVDTTKPAVAYSSDGSGAIFGWSVGQQKWV